jgi:Proto-chlorophyllide reductase 57 kD subunit
MKFLCIACDEPMKITRADPPDGGGSISAVFACPGCGHQIAMLTNAHETQMVQSLGVKIGPGDSNAAASPAGAGASVAASAAAAAEAGGCPFAGMLGEMEAQKDDSIAWTAEAEARLANIPEFVRPMARQGIEHYAKSNGHAVVDDAVMEEARGRFGM